MWLSAKESACQCKRCRFDPWVKKIPWSEKWQPPPVFLPGKSIALIKQTFVSKVTSLLFNSLSRLIIAFLPRSKGLLISWLQPPSTVFLYHIRQ